MRKIVPRLPGVERIWQSPDGYGCDALQALCHFAAGLYYIGYGRRGGKLVGVMQTMLPLVKVEQSRALAVVTLYGCTDSSIYYHLAHEAVDPWKKEEKPKKSKQQLINRLDDYDRWLRH